MNVDYSDAYIDAARRHSDDANFLFKHSRLASADHLFGLAAECALKAVMANLGMEMDSDRPSDPKYIVHINKLWNLFFTFAEGRDAAQITAALGPEADEPNESSNPFHDWDISQRYHHRSSFAASTVERHRAGADRSMKALDVARLRGIIE